eukprot:1786162-Pyramimonas_sp.AAC.1
MRRRGHERSRKPRGQGGGGPGRSKPCRYAPRTGGSLAALSLRIWVVALLSQPGWSGDWDLSTWRTRRSESSAKAPQWRARGGSATQCSSSRSGLNGRRW